MSDGSGGDYEHPFVLMVEGAPVGSMGAKDMKDRMGFYVVKEKFKEFSFGLEGTQKIICICTVFRFVSTKMSAAFGFPGCRSVHHSTRLVRSFDDSPRLEQLGRPASPPSYSSTQTSLGLPLP